MASSPYDTDESQVNSGRRILGHRLMNVLLHMLELVGVSGPFLLTTARAVPISDEIVQPT